MTTKRKRPDAEPPRIDDRYGCIRVGAEYMTGLNVALRSAFFPHYSYAKATQGPVHHSERTADQHDAMPQNPKKRGHLIDRLVNKMCALCANGVALEWLVGDDDPRQHSSDAQLCAEVRGFRRLCVDYVSVQLIPYLVRERLVPVASQVPVADTCVRVGTALDLVCRAADGSHVVFEIKTGFDSYYHRHTVLPMLTPFEYWDDSPASQHQLYLAFALSMYERKAAVRVDHTRCAVLRLTRDGLVDHPLVEWPRKNVTMAQGWAVMARQKQWNHKERNAFVGQKKRALSRKLK